MYMGCDFMDEIKIIDVDENGTPIENIDWSVWQRVRVEEILNGDGKVTEIVSHCVPIPAEKIAAEKAAEALANLKATDYISAKLGDALLSCSSVEDILQTITEFKDQYSNVIAQRQVYRNTINSLS